MTDTDDVLVDSEGNPADAKAEFELRRKVIGRVVKGVRLCSKEPYGFIGNDGTELGRMGATLILSFEDGGDLIIAVPEPGFIELFLANQIDPHGHPDTWPETKSIN